MSEPRSPWVHVGRAAEELLIALTEAVALARDRARGGKRAGSANPLEQAARSALDRTAEWIATADTPFLGDLRRALGDEVRRWDARAATDPAAERVRDLFRATLELFQDDSAEPRPASSANRRSPPSRRSRTTRSAGGTRKPTD